jgi:hypothetical protein
MSSPAHDSFKHSPSDVAQKHDQWVRGIVEAALVVANDPATECIPHETVKARWNAKKNVLQTALAADLYL